MKDRLLPALLWATAVLFVAGIVHIASILVLPRVAPADAFSRLAPASTLDTVELLPRPGPRQEIVPFRDPALASAICRYDLRRGSLKVGAILSDSAFLTMSFHSRRGLAFYGLTDRSGNDGRIDVVLLTPAQLDQAEAKDNEDDPVREVRVTAPEPEGFVQFDVFPRVGGYVVARQALNSVSCALQPQF